MPGHFFVPGHFTICPIFVRRFEGARLATLVTTTVLSLNFANTRELIQKLQWHVGSNHCVRLPRGRRGKGVGGDVQHNNRRDVALGFASIAIAFAWPPTPRGMAVHGLHVRCGRYRGARGRRVVAFRNSLRCPMRGPRIRACACARIRMRHMYMHLNRDRRGRARGIAIGVFVTSNK